MLVTLTSRLRVHRDEVIRADVRANTVVLRFVSMKPMRVAVDDLTEEARHWLLPALAPRAIPVLDEEEDEELLEEEEEDVQVDVKRPHAI